MSRTVYVNGDYLPEEEARISIFDRGFLMADAVYEVTAVLDGRLCDFEGHLRRLDRSLSELRMPRPATDAELTEIHRELVRLNALETGGIYLQATRGAPGDRDFVWPGEETAPTLVLFTQAKDMADVRAAGTGLKIVSLPDLRWGRRDIKTVQLLYPSFAKMEARARGADDAWMVEDGHVTECSAANAYIVTHDGRIVTRQLSHEILHGITRASVLKLAEEAQMVVEERPFTIAEAQGAAEAFVTAATAFVSPVVEIDGVAIGDGTPGPLTRRLREIYIDHARATAI